MGFNLGGAIKGATAALAGVAVGNAIANVLGNLKSGGGLPSKKQFDTGSLGSMMKSVTGKKAKSYNSYLYKYRVKKFQLLIPDEDPINLLPEAIENITIIKEYDNAYHPILQLTTNLPPLIYQKIKNNKDEIQFRLRILKCQFTKSGSVNKKKEFINETFNIIMNEDTDFKDEELYKDANPAAKGETAKKKTVFGLNDYTLQYTFYFWKKSDLDTMRKTVNGVFSDTDISTVMGNLLSDSEVKKVLISPMDNETSYSEIRLPPMALLKVPEYLDRVYGLYYSGSYIFLDYRCLYFLSRNGVCDAKEDDEYTRTIMKVAKATDSKKNSSGTKEDKDNKFYLIDVSPDVINIVEPGKTDNYAQGGDNSKSINSSAGEAVEMENLSGNSNNSDGKVKSNNYGNPYTLTVDACNTIEKSRIAMVQLYDYDEDAFTPNKEFVITFDDKKYKDRNGFYRIVESRHILVKSSSNDLEITGEHKFVYKAPIEVEYNDEEENGGPNVNVTNVAATPAAAAEEAKAEKPMSKLADAGKNMVNTNSISNAASKVTSGISNATNAAKNAASAATQPLKDTAASMNNKLKEAGKLPGSGPKPRLK